MDGSLGRGACRYTLRNGAGNKCTLGTSVALVGLGDGTGGSTLGYGAGSVAVEGVRLGVFLRVIYDICGNNRIGRHSLWSW